MQFRAARGFFREALRAELARAAPPPALHDARDMCRRADKRTAARSSLQSMGSTELIRNFWREVSSRIARIRDSSRWSMVVGRSEDKTCLRSLVADRSGFDSGCWLECEALQGSWSPMTNDRRLATRSLPHRPKLIPEITNSR